MDTASYREYRTASLMKCIAHIVRSKALSSAGPQTRQDIVNDFTTIYHGVDEHDVLLVMNQMVRERSLLQPHGQTGLTRKNEHGSLLEVSPIYIIHPRCDLDKYRPDEACTEHPYKYLLDPHSPAGIEYRERDAGTRESGPKRSGNFADDMATVARLVAESNRLRLSMRDSMPDQLLTQAAGVLEDQVREFAGELQAARDNMGTGSALNVAPGKSFHDIESCSEDDSRPNTWPELPVLPDNPRNLPTSKAGHFPKISEITQALGQLNSKYPNDDLELVFEDNEPRFKCHDCTERLYKVSPHHNCTQNIEKHVESATHADKVESRMARTGEKPIGTTYVEERKQRLHLIRGKDPHSSRWTYRLKINQAQVPRNISTARVQTTKGVVSKESPIVTPATTSNHSINSSSGSQLRQPMVGASSKRSYMGAESSDSRGKRARVTHSQSSTFHPPLTFHRENTSDDEVQLNQGILDNEP
ncbi:hypothetical protein OCU04_002075 [Sclerotinia nivalis]|uniref:Uncharacterized protein n=1 Tax=Sclerotinia nivalis TaxID=352851 RepID=A0A9X0AZD6_9HELO|nr:hypothetical protein OCU04_002075 [Sclerotinia nivalis]